MLSFAYIKALHIIFVVTWFAGLFYIVRLFIYHTEALEKPEPQQSILVAQFMVMQKRLWYGITWPSAILTWLFGGLMIIDNPAFLRMSWFHVKLTAVILLSAYHYSCGVIYHKLKMQQSTLSSSQLRVWNEVATIFLVSIVFIVELQHTMRWMYGLVGLVVFTALLMIAIKWYKKYRSK